MDVLVLRSAWLIPLVTAKDREVKAAISVLVASAREMVVSRAPELIAHVKLEASGEEPAQVGGN